MRTRLPYLAILALLAAAALAGCSGAPSAAAPTATAAAPAAVVPTATIASPATVVPTATVQPPAASPTLAPASVTPTPPAPTAPPPTSTLAVAPTGASSTEGKWEGQDDQGNRVSFQVQENQVTTVIVGYSIIQGGCSINGSNSFSSNTPITNQSFTVDDTSEGDGVKLTGTFDGEKAAGNLEIIRANTTCGDVDFKSKWTARSTPADAASPSTTETSGQTAGGEFDSIDTVDAFFSAIDDQDVDGALALVADNIVFHIGNVSGTGKQDLRAFLETQVKNEVTYTTYSLESSGETVTFTCRTSTNDTPTENNTAVVHNKLVQSLTVK